MKKILFIHHASGWGGAPINMINIINELKKSEYEVNVLLIKDSIVSTKLAEFGISFTVAEGRFFRHFYMIYVHILPNYTKWYNLILLIYKSFIWLLARYYFIPNELKKYTFDIVHLNSSALTDWLAPCKKRAHVIMHVQEPLSYGRFRIRYNFFRRQMDLYADRIIAISNDNALRINLPLKTRVVYNFTTISKTIKDNSSYQSKVVLYVGGDSFIKGFSTIVDALDFIDKDIKIIFAGSYIQSFNGKLKKMSVLEVVKFILSNRYRTTRRALYKMRSSNNIIEVGLVNDVVELIDRSCCLVSPFTISHFSRPVIEAFANFKPVIVTEVDGIDEVVDRNINGIVVSKDNSLELALAINYICNNPSIARNFGLNGYNIAKVKYSSSNIEKIKSIYEEII